MIDYYRDQLGSPSVVRVVETHPLGHTFTDSEFTRIDAVEYFLDFGEAQ